MLKKLLKYDLKSVFRYWWILAASCLVISAAAGFAYNVIESDTDLPTVLYIFSGLTVFAFVIALFALLFLSKILMYVRFYQNLFSDEGYLTFTLPVKRHHILMSKLITDVLLSVASLAVTWICIETFSVIIGTGFISYEMGRAIWALCTVLAKSGITPILLIAELILATILLALISSLTIFACITIGAVIAKKHKVLAAIGTGYVFNMVSTFILQIVMIFGMIGLAGLMMRVSDAAIPAIGVLMGFIAVLLLAVIYVLLFTIELRMLDKKLNLA